MSQQDAFGAVISSLHDAALDGDLWPQASARIDAVCGMRSSGFVVARGCSRDDVDILFASLCEGGVRREDWEEDYFRDDYPHDERVPRLPQLPDSRLTPMTELYTEQERKTSAVYNGGMLRRGYQNGLHVRLDGPGGSSIYWTLGNSTQSGGWSGRQIGAIQALLPHLRHLVRVRYTLECAQSLSASLAGLLANTRLGVVYLDRRGRIVEANDRAQTFLQHGRGVFERKGHLRARRPEEDRCLEGLIGSALPGFMRQPSGGSMTVRRWPARFRQVVHVVPMKGPGGGFGFGASGMAVLVLLVEPGAPERLEPGLVGTALGLTDTEARVAVDLAMGKTVAQIAAETRRQVSTVRFHVKEMHAKLGIGRQTDLVRLVLSLAG